MGVRALLINTYISIIYKRNVICTKCQNITLLKTSMCNMVVLKTCSWNISREYA